MDGIPTLFSGKDVILQYDYDQIDSLVGSEIDHYEFIENLSVPDPMNTLCKEYFKSIMMGYNHVFIERVMKQCKTTSNICLPLVHHWFSSTTKKDVRIDNIVIIRGIINICIIYNI